MPEKKENKFRWGSAPDHTPDFVVHPSPEKVLKLKYNEARGDIQKV